MDLLESGLLRPINHWYYRHKFWFIREADCWENPGVKSLVDIGAGSALFSKELLRLNLVSRVVAVDTGYKDESKTEGGITFCKKVDYSGFTHFLLTDVLEHIENDKDFLSKIVAQADDKASFCITVPAHMSLWSGHDVYLKHFRRYTKKELKNLVQESGLSVNSIRYTYSTLFPIAWIQRKTTGKNSKNSQLREIGWIVSQLIQVLLLPDRWVPFAPFGISLFLDATKNV